MYQWMWSQNKTKQKIQILLTYTWNAQTAELWYNILDVCKTYIQSLFILFPLKREETKNKGQVPHFFLVSTIVHQKRDQCYFQNSLSISWRGRCFLLKLSSSTQKRGNPAILEPHILAIWLHMQGSLHSSQELKSFHVTGFLVFPQRQSDYFKLLSLAMNLGQTQSSLVLGYRETQVSTLLFFLRNWADQWDSWVTNFSGSCSPSVPVAFQKQSQYPR